MNRSSRSGNRFQSFWVFWEAMNFVFQNLSKKITQHPKSVKCQAFSRMPNPADQKKDIKKTKCSDRVWNSDQGMYLVQNLTLNRMLMFSDLYFHFLQVFSTGIQMPNLVSCQNGKYGILQI